MLGRTRLHHAIGLGLVSATLACSPPPGETPVVPRGTNWVALHVVCPPPQANTAVKVFLHPQNRRVDQNVNVYWTRTTAGNGTHSSTFSIQPAKTDTWPWTDGDFPWSHATRIDGTAKTNHASGEYKYNITFECNGDQVVLDPRMIIN